MSCFRKSCLNAAVRESYFEDSFLPMSELGPDFTLVFEFSAFEDGTIEMLTSFLLKKRKEPWLIVADQFGFKPS